MLFYIIAFIAGICIIAGMLLGFMLMNVQFRNRLTVVVVSIFRIFTKSIRRVKLGIDEGKLIVDENFKSLSQEDKVKVADQKALDVVKMLKQRLERLYGPKIVAMFLFGSRARGDFSTNSDVDVGVYLDTIDTNKFKRIKKEAFYYSFEILMKYGYYIQLRFYDSRILTGQLASKNYLAKAAYSYGILI